jgi:hypothetical protein
LNFDAILIKGERKRERKREREREREKWGEIIYLRFIYE